jgi:hypothetical protein
MTRNRGEEMNEIRNRFLDDVDCVKEPKVITVAVELPTGAIEIITNTQFVKEKIQYYLQAYDDEFRLRANPAIAIVGHMIV